MLQHIDVNPPERHQAQNERLAAPAGGGHCNPPASIGLAKRQKVRAFLVPIRGPLNSRPQEHCRRRVIDARTGIVTRKAEPLQTDDIFLR
jgi:hypothetical protein